MGIEPTSEAWEASILPLYDARSAAFNSTHNRGAVTTASPGGQVRLAGMLWSLQLGLRAREIR